MNTEHPISAPVERKKLLVSFLDSGHKERFSISLKQTQMEQHSWYWLWYSSGRDEKEGLVKKEPLAQIKESNTRG